MVYYPSILEVLPSLVVDNLLSYLDFHEHLKLRELCKTTKSWVESTNFLKIFENYPDDLYFISQENLSPTRLNIEWGNYLEENNLLENILAQIGGSLTFLKISRFNGSKVQLDALNCCTNLEYLSIEILDLSASPACCTDSEEFTGFTKLLKSLKHFSVCRILIRYPASTELEYFGKLLKQLWSLRTLNVPSVEEKNGRKMDEDVLLSINYGFVVGPIIKYITRRAYHDPDKENLHSLDLQGFEIGFFEIFPELVRLCNKTGTRLENVDYPLVRKLVAMRYDPKLLKVVRSVRNRLVGNANVFLELKSVRRIKLDLNSSVVYIPPEIGAREQFFPELEKLELNCWNDKGKEADASHGEKLNGMEKVAGILFGEICNRKRLKELSLTCNSSNSTAILYPVSRIVAYLYNLTVLKVKDFLKFTNEDFIAVVRNLKKLKQLEIDDEWGGITDEGICSKVEDGELDIFKLTDLIKLKIKCKCKYTGAFYPNGQSYMWPWSKLKKFSNSANKHYISDYSFKEVFRHLRLRSFLVESADIHVTKLGYYSLLEGGFADSIEYFPCPEYLPTGLTENEFFLMRSNFKHFCDIQPFRNSRAQFQDNSGISNCAIV